MENSIEMNQEKEQKLRKECVDRAIRLQDGVCITDTGFDEFNAIRTNSVIETAKKLYDFINNKEKE